VSSYLPLIISDILPFCSWLDANGILHGILLAGQASWLLCCGSEKTESTRQESVGLRQPAQDNSKQHSPYHRRRDSHTVLEPWQSTLQCPCIQVQAVQKPYKEASDPREPSPYSEQQEGGYGTLKRRDYWQPHQPTRGEHADVQLVYSIELST
jgi:hypothetical protein